MLRTRDRGGPASNCGQVGEVGVRPRHRMEETGPTSNGEWPTFLVNRWCEEPWGVRLLPMVPELPQNSSTRSGSDIPGASCSLPLLRLPTPGLGAYDFP